MTEFLGETEIPKKDQPEAQREASNAQVETNNRAEDDDQPELSMDISASEPESAVEKRGDFQDSEAIEAAIVEMVELFTPVETEALDLTGIKPADPAGLDTQSVDEDTIASEQSPVMGVSRTMPADNMLEETLANEGAGDPARQYSAVQMTQGKVAIETDWNETETETSPGPGDSIKEVVPGEARRPEIPDPEIIEGDDPETRVAGERRLDAEKGVLQESRAELTPETADIQVNLKQHQEVVQFMSQIGKMLNDDSTGIVRTFEDGAQHGDASGGARADEERGQPASREIGEEDQDAISRPTYEAEDVAHLMAVLEQTRQLMSDPVKEQVTRVAEAMKAQDPTGKKSVELVSHVQDTAEGEIGDADADVVEPLALMALYERWFELDVQESALREEYEGARKIEAVLERDLDEVIEAIDELWLEAEARDPGAIVDALLAKYGERDPTIYESRKLLQKLGDLGGKHSEGLSAQELEAIAVANKANMDEIVENVQMIMEAKNKGLEAIIRMMQQRFTTQQQLSESGAR